jgi:hypothetical protein
MVIFPTLIDNQDTITVPIFDQDFNRPSLKSAGVDHMYFKAWAELNIVIQAAAGVTVIVDASMLAITLLLMISGYSR